MKHIGLIILAFGWGMLMGALFANAAISIPLAILGGLSIGYLSDSL
jgi:hypothetical protein